MVKKEGSDKYTRREFLKASGKTAVGAGFYGTIGGTLGKGYDELKNIFYSGTKAIGNRLTAVEDKVDSLADYHPAKVAKSVEETRSNFFRNLFGRSEEDQAKWREEHEIKHPKSYKTVKSSTKEPEVYSDPAQTRRGFLKSLVGYAHEHPVSSGAGVGASYGGIKSGVRASGKYKTRVREHKKDLRIERLESEVEELKGGLEKEIDGPVTMIILSLVGMLISLVLLTSGNMTGNVILLTSDNPSVSLGIVLFFSCLTILFLSIKIKNKKI